LHCDSTCYSTQDPEFQPLADDDAVCNSCRACSRKAFLLRASAAPGVVRRICSRNGLRNRPTFVSAATSPAVIAARMACCVHVESTSTRPTNTRPVEVGFG